MLLAVAGMPGFGQPAPAPAPAPAPWSAGPINFSGLVDGYYSFNFNHPATGFNGLYNFNVKANQFSLNMAKLSMEYAPDPVGFRVDFGFGRAFEMIHSYEPTGTPAIMRNIQQAYVSLKPSKTRAVQFDFGKFVTSAGAEVIETHSNWNYSRSILFAWAIPYYHYGLRMTASGAHFSGGFQLVNGWNNVEDNNSGKTIGLTGNIVSSKVSWFNTYYTGPENGGTNTGWRNLYDTNLVLTPSPKFNAYINFDYGRNRIGSGSTSSSPEWYGIAGAAKWQMSDKHALVPRIEWFKDKDGFSTGTVQALKEFTLTYEYKLPQGFFTRLEYRRDWSDVAFFERGDGGTRKNQDTLSAGFVVFFGPK
jgi:hypothetical protein